MYAIYGFSFGEVQNWLSQAYRKMYLHNTEVQYNDVYYSTMQLCVIRLQYFPVTLTVNGLIPYLELH